MSENKPNELAVRETNIPGFYIVDLVLHHDSRGYFKEGYQKEKMEALGLPNFDPIDQNNISKNKFKGAIRGLHAEPWEKYIQVVNGRAFGAWVDLRAGDTFGETLTLELDETNAVLVPRGVANGYQTLEDNVVYSYLVNKHWSPEAKYTHVNLFDPELDIEWPIAKEDSEFSEKDANQPLLKDVVPVEV